MIESKFSYVFKNTSNCSIAVVVDEGTNENKSVVKDIVNISQMLSSENILYRDRDECWAYWSKKEGFRSLHVLLEGKMIPPPTLDIAMQITINRHLQAW